MLADARWQATAARLARHIRTPLYRNAYAWLVSTGLSSVLGILYWVLAARFYSLEVVGVGAALVSMLFFIGGVAQLNLMSALVRFLPTAGAQTARLTLGSYLLAAGLALLLSVAFLIVSSRVPGLDLFGLDARLRVLFVPAAIAWTVFSLQDSVLTGLRAALWVPVDNICYAVAKLVLLVVLAPLLPRAGIFVSWIAPAVVLLVPFNLMILTRLIPRHVAATQANAVPLRLWHLTRYIGSNYLGSLFSLTAARALPTLVVAVAGTTAAAYFYVAWTIASSLKLVTVQMATSLTVEGVLDEGHLATYARKFLRVMFGLFIPVVVLLLVAAPWLLSLSGEAYATEGVALLRLLTVAVVPSLLVTWYISIARIRQWLLEIAVAEMLSAILVLALSYPLLQTHGVTGVGLATLISAVVVAALFIPRYWVALRPVTGQERHP